MEKRLSKASMRSSSSLMSLASDGLSAARADTKSPMLAASTSRSLSNAYNWLICSAPGEDGGYYLAATREEFNEFCDRELHPKAMDMLETESAMKAAARRMWGDAVQMELIR